MNPVPPNVGTKARGKLSADQWHIFCVIHLPILLIPLWYHKSNEHRARLDNFMDLVTEVVVGSLLEMSEPAIQLYEEVALRYLKTAKKLYNISITPNQHNSLHIPFFLRLFGPLHAVRTFFSERTNFRLQGTNTNMKFGDVFSVLRCDHTADMFVTGEIESTYMQHNCRAANFRALVEDGRIRGQVLELIEAFEETAAEDRRGTRLRESTFLGADPMEKRTSKPLKKLTLTDDCFRALIKYLNGKAGQELFIDVREMREVPGSQQVINRALKCPRVFCGGVSFLSASDSPRDSNIMFHSPTTSSPRAGRILQIFKYSVRNARGRLTESTYLYVAPLDPLSSQDAAHDPYRSYAYVGGELYYDRYLPGIIITPEDVVSHFARTPLTIGAIVVPCVHVGSLDKVRQLYSCQPYILAYCVTRWQTVRLVSRENRPNEERQPDESSDMVMEEEGEDVVELWEL